MKSVLVPHDRKSVVDDMAWGVESVLDVNNRPSMCADICPRAMRLTGIMPPQFMTHFLWQVVPKVAQQRPQPDRGEYWEEVARILWALHADELRIESPTYRAFLATIATQLSEPAQTFLQGKELMAFCLCFLQPPAKFVHAPDAGMKTELLELYRGLYATWTRDDKTRRLAQLALETVIRALATWELDDRLKLTMQSLAIPPHLARYHPDDKHKVTLDAEGRLVAAPGVIEFEVAAGLLMVGAQRLPTLRKLFYHDFIRSHLRRRDWGEYDNACNIVREDPLMVRTLLGKFPPRFPGSTFEREFVEAIYAGFSPDDIPPDVGRQALAFGCEKAVRIWWLMFWPRSRLIQRRLHALSCTSWCIRKGEFVEVVYRSFT